MKARLFYIISQGQLYGVYLQKCRLSCPIDHHFSPYRTKLHGFILGRSWHVECLATSIIFSLCGGINSDMSTIYDDFHAYSGHNECDTNRRLWFFVKRFFVKRFFVKRFFVYRYTNTEYSHIYITASVTVFFGSTDTKVCIVTLTGMVLLYFSWVQFSRDYSSTT
jgi:hypothetical protein